MTTKRIIDRIRTFIGSAALAASVSLGISIAQPALASGGAVEAFADGSDVVKTTDGRTLEGTIVREVNGYVWIDMGVGNPLMLRPDQIQSIERDADTEVSSEPVSRDAGEQTWERREGVTRAAIITAEEMVGVWMSAKPLEEAIPVLKDEGVDLVVLKIKSGGGLLLEIQKISDVLHEQYKPNFQLVAWIESAISAAAMSAHAIEDIYFMPRANYGACTGWSGALEAVEGRQLEAVLYMMEQISERGNKDYRIMRSMQINEPLSFDIEADGERKFYLSTEGEHLLNDGEYILTLNAESAEHADFSQGTAGTLEELTALLEASIGEIEWVGEKIPGEPFPISKGEQLQRDWREEMTRQENRWVQIMIQYEMEIGNASSVPLENRGGFIRKASRYLSQVRKMYDDNPNFGLLRGITDEWFIEQQRRLEELRR
ncbi:MAG: hypothetical protein AAF937_02365 [Planctomycetota bacterium]